MERTVLNKWLYDGMADKLPIGVPIERERLEGYLHKKIKLPKSVRKMVIKELNSQGLIKHINKQKLMIIDSGQERHQWF